MKRPYRLEFNTHDAHWVAMRTYSTEGLARAALGEKNNPGRWRITLRAERDRRTTELVRR